MNALRQPEPPAPPASLKSFSGRPRKWDERITPQGVVDRMAQEVKKLPWLLYVCVQESGEVIPASTLEVKNGKREMVARLEADPAVGFVGCLRRDAERIQFFSRPLKAGPKYQKLLDDTITWLSERAGLAVKAIVLKPLSVQREGGKK